MELLVVTYLLKAVLILVLSRVIPGLQVSGFGSALSVAVVYALLSTALMWLLKILTFPLIILSFGLFVFVLHAFLLWMTDKLLKGFEVRGLGTLLLTAVAFSVGNVAVESLVPIILR